MLGVPLTLADGDTVIAFGGRLMTTSERGAGLRVLVPSILSIVAPLTTPRTLNVPDADVTLYAGGITGVNKLTIAGVFSNPRTVTFPDATGTLALAQFSNIFTGQNSFQNATGQRFSQTATTDAIVIAPANVGSSSNTITDTTPATALGANFTQTRQAKTGTLALAETSTVHGFKNLLHNGRVLVDQRATLTTPATVTTGTPTYGPDGWLGNKTNATMVATIGKVAVVNTPMVGSLDACKLNVTTLAAVAAGDSLSIQRRIEGTFFRRCGFGTAQAVPVYVSFWAEASATGTFSVALRNGATGRSYVVNFTIAAANTRQLCQVTIPGDTTGTWAVDTTNAAFLDITAAVGATFQTAAGAWQAGNFFGTSSATILNNLVGSISISDLYLGTEPIGTATSDYPHIPFDQELRRCLRYLPSWTPLASAGAAMGQVSLSTQAYIIIQFKQTARASVTGITIVGATNFCVTTATVGQAQATAITIGLGGYESATVIVTVASGLVAGNATFMFPNTGTTAQILFTGAEL